MSDVSLLEGLSKSKFQDRLVPAANGRILLLSRDRKKASWFMTAEIESLNDDVTSAVAPTGRMLKRSLWLNVPFALLLLSILSYFKLAKPIDALGPFASYATLLFMVAGLPLFMLFRHYRALNEAMALLDQRVANRCWFEAPPLRGRRKVDATEIVGLLLVGPNIVASLLCSIDPNILRNTPWTRSEPEAITVIVILALIGRRVLGRSARILVSEQVLPPEPVRRGFGRRV
jgi:hypothetical protein